MLATSLISGGSRGLGLATVERLLERGDQVATFSRSGSDRLEALVSAHPGRLFVERIDAADAAAIRGFVERAAERFGRIDHCIANAAIAGEGVLATFPDAEIDALLAVNLKGSIVLAREVIRQMLTAASGSPSITFISSITAARGSPGLSVYAATKAALEGLARSLARELGPRGIRVNAIAPGFLETDLSGSLGADDRARIARRTALGRLGVPDDVVGAIDFLTSDRAAFITGQVITIDGGT